MEIAQQTHSLFQDGIRVKIVRVETPTTMWVRIKGWPTLTYMLNWDMHLRPPTYVPESSDLTPGTFVAVKVCIKRNAFWERGIVSEQTPTGCTVYLIDWGLKTHHEFSSMRLLPEKFKAAAPWVRKIRLRDVQDQERKSKKHYFARLLLLKKRTGYLYNIDTSPGDTMSATFMMDWREGQPLRDVGAYFLKMKFVNPGPS